MPFQNAASARLGLAGIVWLLVSSTSSFAQELPVPVVEFRFDQGFANSGSAGGEGQPVDYAPEEGPLLSRGPWGDCLDLNGASRFGGTLNQMAPAGGAVLFEHDEIPNLKDITITLWVNGSAAAPAVNSRLITCSGAWELVYYRGLPGILISVGEKKISHHPPRPALDYSGQWMFWAVSISQGRGEVSILYGDREGRMIGRVTHSFAGPFAASPAGLEIGNYRGIRPFKGQLDNLRIFDRVLSPEEVGRVLAGDIDAAPESEGIYASAWKSSPRRRFHFNKADVPFSSRWQRRSKEVFPLLEEYHATHLLWVYGSKPDFIRKTHDLGIFYQASLNGLWGYQKSSPQPNAAGDTSGRQQDFDGNKIILSHMKKWKWKQPRWTGCHNSPDFRRLFFAAADDLVNAGVDAIHVDDYEMSLWTSASGLGCFCPHCMNRFRQYLEQNLDNAALLKLGIENIDSFEYAEFLRQKHGITSAEEYRKKFDELPLTGYFLAAQTAGLRDFYKALRRHLDQVSPEKYIPVSVNNQFYRRTRDGHFRGVFSVDILDFFIGEATQSMQSVFHYVYACRAAEAFGIPQVMMNKPKILAHAQAALATSYALGSLFRVPWDLYMDNNAEGQPAPRYFGQREDWLPFYDFIHANPGLFNGTQAAASAAILFNGDEPAAAVVWDACRELVRAQVQFRLVAAASRFNRIALDEKSLSHVRHILQLSAAESFCEEDQQVIERLHHSRRIRFHGQASDVVQSLEQSGERILHVEGPDDVNAFVRVQPDEENPVAIIHVVNWNAQSDGQTDTFRNVTLRLDSPARWGEDVSATLFQPGQAGGERLEVEAHSRFLRVNLPELKTWAVIQLRPPSRGLR